MVVFHAPQIQTDYYMADLIYHSQVTELIKEV